MASLFDRARAKLGLYNTPSGYFPELTTDLGRDTGSGKSRDGGSLAKSAAENRKKRRRKRRLRQQREEAARRAAEETAAKAAAEEEAQAQPDLRESVADVTTSSGSRIGTTSVTPQSIYQKPVEEAISEQERLAQEELKRQRIKRAREKQSLLRRRLERRQDLGAGKRVLSGTEQELNVQTRQAGSGRRSGTGRRSLITGSTGGIGYYSRFL